VLSPDRNADRSGPPPWALTDGSFGRDGVFHAKQLQAKRASKYAPLQAPEARIMPAMLPQPSRSDKKDKSRSY
jgi:hypothetical protein